MINRVGGSGAGNGSVQGAIPLGARAQLGPITPKAGKFFPHWWPRPNEKKSPRRQQIVFPHKSRRPSFARCKITLVFPLESRFFFCSFPLAGRAPITVRFSQYVRAYHLAHLCRPIPHKYSRVPPLKILQSIYEHFFRTFANLVPAKQA